MSKKIYVGNLSFKTTEEGLHSLFSQFGLVVSAQVVRDRLTDQSRGFGFVEMELEAAADDAIVSLNGQMVDGRRIRVNAAEEKPAGFNQERRPGGFHRGESYSRGERNRADAGRGRPRESPRRLQRDSWDYSY